MGGWAVYNMYCKPTMSGKKKYGDNSVMEGEGGNCGRLADSRKRGNAGGVRV